VAHLKLVFELVGQVGLARALCPEYVQVVFVQLLVNQDRTHVGDEFMPSYLDLGGSVHPGWLVYAQSGTGRLHLLAVDLYYLTETDLPSEVLLVFYHSL
jgi:hypothetical protein